MSSAASINRSSTEAIDHGIPGAFPDPEPSPLSTQQSLSEAIHARRSEYTRPRNVRIKVGTWNVASFKGTDKDVGGWFVGGKGVAEALAGLTITTLDGRSKGDIPKSRLQGESEGVTEQEQRQSEQESTLPENDQGTLPGGSDIALYALGLQEIVDINSAAEALRPYTDPTVANTFKIALQEALPPGYQLIAEQQLIGLLLLVYASPEVVPDVRSISTTSVGTGLMGYMGNKGAVTARVVLGETTRLVFINSHLAAGVEKAALERRNWDAGQIASRTRFAPIVDSLGITQTTGERIGDEDFAFWFGDLNYRLEGIPGDDVRRILMLHIRNQYDIGTTSDSKVEEELSQSSTAIKASDAKDASGSSASILGATTAASDDVDDPASLQATLSSLLPHDELHQQMKARKAFHQGWREGSIRFLPTYKYDVGSVGVFDSSDRRRCPSWCDRILFRTRKDIMSYEAKLQEEEAAKKRDEQMKANGTDRASEDEDVLFDYDPTTDADDDYDEHADAEAKPINVTTKEGFEDEIQLEYYTSHQRVLSSDHKPLDAVFALKYDAVVPELKARIHQEVARELDRAENEGRPTITLIVDQPNGPTGKGRTDDDGTHFEGVDFGDVRYADTKRRTVTIANTGQVPATISFVDRPVGQGQSAGTMPQWLSVQFDREADKPSRGQDQHPSYTLDPGDTCSVELILQVAGTDLVRSLNDGSSTLEDILVLRVHNGRDHFIPVRGRWLQSSFGHSISKLIRIPEGGIRKLQQQRPESGSGHRTDGAGDEHAVKWSAPRELFRLTEVIEDLVVRAVAEWDMTGRGEDKPPWEENAGWPFEKESWTLTNGAERDRLKSQVYEALDCDQPFESAFEAETPVLYRLEVLSEILLDFLESLQDGIVTEELWAKLERDIAAREKNKQHLSLKDERYSILEVLSTDPNHNVSFVLITSMLFKLINEITTSASIKNAELPSSPRKTNIRRKTLSKEPAVARRQLVERSFAAIFAKVMIRLPEASKGRNKERRLSEERRVRVVELFLKGDGSAL